MKNLLLVENSSTAIKKSGDGSYILEGIFTELGSENRNGRVYTEEGFLPHLEALQKIVEAGKCVGELDHPKVFETSLKNASHKIEKIWYDKSEGKVYGRIKLLNTDAGRNAKALVDDGIPLHISSRAAGTVAENKTVKIHKLFTYDLVADPGFENAVLNTVNESYGFDTPTEDKGGLFIYEVSESATPAEEARVGIEGLVTEEELDSFTVEVKKSIDSLKDELANIKKMQEALGIQNNEIAEGINSESIQEAIEEITTKIAAIEKWSEHVTEEFKLFKEANSTPGASEDLLKRIASLEEKFDGIEAWSEHVTETVTAIENWSEEATTTVTAIEDWAEHTTESVTKVEETLTAVHTWTEEATAAVTKLEETVSSNHPVNEEEEGKTEEGEHEEEEKDEEVVDETYINSIYTKIDSIISNAKKQKAEKEEELIKESKKAEEEAEKDIPLYLKMMPEKYGELWEALSDSKRSSINKRANICDFNSERSIKEFWDATFAGTSLEMIKESAKTPEQVSEEDAESRAKAKRQKIVEAYKKSFNK